LDLVSVGFDDMVKHMLERPERKVALVPAPFSSGLGGVGGEPVLCAATKVAIAVPQAANLVLLIDVNVA